MGLPEILTERLTIAALSLKELEWYLNDPFHLEKELGFAVSREAISEVVNRAMRIKSLKMSAAPASDHAWYTYWLVIVNAVPFGAGLAGFKGVPNERGEVEIGYGIDPAYRSRGYTTEAVSALVDWALRQPRCTSVTAETHKSNTPSIRVLQKIGMQLVSETEEAYFWEIRGSAVGKD